ncbi:MAG: acyl-ACP--UDP-N-acetylglucosamine O-acyltransferase [Lentisphaerae bacterium]|nr:acyl-ACP--UDP-N-acetylglucosamine O-acyltransferase [Lentisphaerota bacterium]
MSTIHPTAVIHPGARVGQDVSIGPFACIEEDVVIGDGCHVGPHASLLRYTALGARCRVHAGAVLGDWPQDLSFAGAVSSVRIGSGCVFREGVTVHRGTKEGTATVIGDQCYLMANSHVAHNVKLGNRVILANGVLLAGYVEVGDGAFISGNCLVHQFVRIGRLAMLGGGSGIGQDVPPFMTTHSMGLNAIAGLNVIGLRRAGIGSADRLAIKRAFALLYRAGLNVPDAVARIRAEIPEAPAQELCDFVAGAKRGICQARRGVMASATSASEES